MREATDEDIPRILEMSRAYHASQNRPWPLDEGAAGGFFQWMIGDDSGLLLVSDKGFAGAIANAHPLSPGWLMVTELFLWSEDGQGAAFIRAIRRWKEDLGASEMRWSSPVENERFVRFMGRLGRPDEIIYSEV